MKKLITILIAICLLGLLFGCTSQSDDKSAMDKNDSMMEKDNGSMDDQTTVSDSDVNTDLDDTVIEDQEIDVGEMF